MRLLLIALLALFTLAACNGKKEAPPVAAVAVPTVEANAQAVALFSACAVKANATDAKASLGKFMVTTNVWNASAAAGYTECLKARHNNATGLIDAELTWNVVESNNQVLAFPNFAYGWQVGTDQGSTTKRLPAQVGSLPDLIASGRIETVCAAGVACTMNTAFELLFAKTPTPDTWPPTAEIMVWVQATCKTCNAGQFVEKVNIDGVVFEIYKGQVTPPTGTASWTYVAYVAENTVTQLNFNMKNFTNDALKRGYLQADDYLAVVELGTEITAGQGTTTLSGYGIR